MSDTPFLSDVHAYLSKDARVVFEDDGTVPAIWRGYLSKDRQNRLDYLRTEFRSLSESLPNTIDAIELTAVDIFVVEYTDSKIGKRYARIINKRNRISSNDEKLYGWISLSVSIVDLQNHIDFIELLPERLTWMYKTMFDGLKSLYGGGLYNLDEIQPISEMDDVFFDRDWFKNLTKEGVLDDILEVATNGGGVSVLFDLKQAKSLKPRDGLAIWAGAKDGKFEDDLDFWDFLDAILSIMIGGG